MFTIFVPVDRVSIVDHPDLVIPARSARSWPLAGCGAVGPLVPPVGVEVTHAAGSWELGGAAVVIAVQVDLVVPVDPVAVRGSGVIKMLDGNIGIIDPVPARDRGGAVDPEGLALYIDLYIAQKIHIVEVDGMFTIPIPKDGTTIVLCPDLVISADLTGLWPLVGHSVHIGPLVPPVGQFRAHAAGGGIVFGTAVVIAVQVDLVEPVDPVATAIMGNFYIVWIAPFPI